MTWFIFFFAGTGIGVLPDGLIAEKPRTLKVGKSSRTLKVPKSVRVLKVPASGA